MPDVDGSVLTVHVGPYAVDISNFTSVGLGELH